MSQSAVTVRSVEISEATLLAYFDNRGYRPARQCCEGFCGTCAVKVSNIDAFEEVFEQIGFKNDDEVLLCAVRLKEAEEAEVYLPGP